MADDYGIPQAVLDSNPYLRQKVAMSMQQPPMSTQPQMSPAMQQPQEIPASVSSPTAIPKFQQPAEPMTRGAMALQKPNQIQPIQPSPAELGHQEQFNKLSTHGSGISQIHNPVGRTLLTALDAIGSGLFPNIAMNIPGTQAHHNLLLNQEHAALGQEQQNRKDTSLEQVQAAQANKDLAGPNAAPHTITTAEGIQQFNPETQRFDISVGQAPAKEEVEGKTITTDQGVMQWNPQTKRYDINAGGAPGAKGGSVHQLEDGTLIMAHGDGSATPITVNGIPAKGRVPAGASEETNDIKNYNQAKKEGYKGTFTQWQTDEANRHRPTVDHGQNMVDPATNRLVRVQPGGAVPQGAMTASTLSSQNAPTTTQRDAAGRAVTMTDLDTRIRRALQNPEIAKGTGPLAGRLAEVQSRLGTLPHDLSELKNDLVSYGAFQAGLHPVRGIGALEYFDKVMGGLGQDVPQLLGKLDSNRATAESVKRVGGVKGESVPEVKSQAEFDKLPSGAIFMEDGKRMRKP